MNDQYLLIRTSVSSRSSVQSVRQSVIVDLYASFNFSMAVKIAQLFFLCLKILYGLYVVLTTSDCQNSLYLILQGILVQDIAQLIYYIHLTLSLHHYNQQQSHQNYQEIEMSELGSANNVEHNDSNPRNFRNLINQQFNIQSSSCFCIGQLLDWLYVFLIFYALKIFFESSSELQHKQVNSEQCRLSQTNLQYQSVALYLILAFMYLFVPALIIITILFSLPLFIFLYLILRNEQSTQIHKETLDKMNRLSFDELQQMFIKYEIQEYEQICSICTVEYQQSDQLMVLPCNQLHFFCQQCITKWLLISKNCPICRADMDLSIIQHPHNIFYNS